MPTGAVHGRVGHADDGGAAPRSLGATPAVGRVRAGRAQGLPAGLRRGPRGVAARPARHDAPRRCQGARRTRLLERRRSAPHPHEQRGDCHHAGRLVPNRGRHLDDGDALGRDRAAGLRPPRGRIRLPGGAVGPRAGTAPALRAAFLVSARRGVHQRRRATGAPHRPPRRPRAVTRAVGGRGTTGQDRTRAGAGVGASRAGAGRSPRLAARVRADGGRISAVAAGGEGRHAGGRDRDHRAADGRVGDRQGGDRPLHPSRVDAAARPLRGGQLRGAARAPARVRTVRARARGVHRRSAAPGRSD